MGPATQTGSAVSNTEDQVVHTEMKLSLLDDIDGLREHEPVHKDNEEQESSERLISVSADVVPAHTSKGADSPKVREVQHDGMALTTVESSQSTTTLQSTTKEHEQPSERPYAPRSKDLAHQSPTRTVAASKRQYALAETSGDGVALANDDRSPAPPMSDQAASSKKRQRRRRHASNSSIKRSGRHSRKKTLNSARSFSKRSRNSKPPDFGLRRSVKPG